MRALLFFLLIPALRADERTQKLIDGLSKQADAFQRIAPAMLGRETLHHRFLKPPPRFRPRIGEAAKKPLQPTWQERDIISEYAFAALGDSRQELHEMRRVIAVDGRIVEEEKQAQDSLAKLVTASDDQRKRVALKQLEKYGLRGAAVDFGQLLLLFSRRDVERYEFTFSSTEQVDGLPVTVFRYKQLDGPEAMTVFDGDKLLRLRVEGEVWVRSDTYAPARITLVATQGESGAGLREEATVQYVMSPYGVLLPSAIEQQELRDGQVTSESKFVYANFHKFQTSSDIKFGDVP
jgi:CBS domain-containing protein